MAKVNIPSSVGDPEYRYKMPQLILKQESSGNGSKTCIVNVRDVARALHRPPEYLAKWFGHELGAIANKAKGEEDMRSVVVTGHRGTQEMQGSLDKFIRNYVLCAKCHLPEIDLGVKKSLVVAKCRACGWRGPMDSEHKIAKFIVAHPPNADGHGYATRTDVALDSGKMDRQTRRALKAQQQAELALQQRGKQGETSAEQVDEASCAFACGVSSCDPAALKSKSKQGKEKLPKAEKSSQRPGYHKVCEGKCTEVAAATVSVDEDGLQCSEYVIQDLKEFLSRCADRNASQCDVDGFFQHVRMHQIAKGFDHKTRLLVVMEAIFGSALSAQKLDKDRALVHAFVTKPKLNDPEVLWAFGAYLDRNSGIAKAYPMLLKAIYDEEWVTEEGILRYYSQAHIDVEDPGFEVARSKASPFLKWLETTPSSSDDDGDE